MMSARPSQRFPPPFPKYNPGLALPLFIYNKGGDIGDVDAGVDVGDMMWVSL